jgi:cyclopropane fatty-acyl-phospholipid synthase-like methyltransferase
MNKPYSPACDNNREPILAVIRPLLQHAAAVLEIGTGTGQHAVYFARELPHLVWYTSDVPGNHSGIRQWLREAKLSNTRPPVTLDVARDRWPGLEVDAVFSANTAHIMHWPEVEHLFAGAARLLPRGGLFILYGPFNFNNEYTSDSNRRFDAMLRSRDPGGGIRDFEDLDGLAFKEGMKFRRRYPMPANNHILCWEKN